MKNNLLLALMGLVIVAAGCVGTVDGNKAGGLPLIKDRIEARYDRPADERGALGNREVRLDLRCVAPIHFCNAIGIEHGFRFVGREREFELMFGLESCVACHRIGRYAENCRAGLFEFAPQAIKFDRFLGAAGGIVFRIEVKNKLSAGEACERNPGSGIVRQREIRRLVARRQLFA